MTDTQILDLLTIRLVDCIEDYDRQMKQVTDTGLMWRRTAYKEILNYLNLHREKRDQEKGT